MSRRRTKIGAHSPVELQFAVRYAIARKGGPNAGARRKMTRAVLAEAVQYWIDEGDNPPGFEVTPIRWVHENKTTDATDDESFRAVLGRLLQGGNSIAFKIRGHEGI